MRGGAEPKNHNPTLHIYRVISPLSFFIIVACQGHILDKSTKVIDIKLGLQIDSSEGKAVHQNDNSILYIDIVISP